MGANLANDLAGLDSLSTLEQIRIHLTHNFYPPVPASMVQPCIDAITAFHEEDCNREIDLQGAAQWRGNSFAPASAIVEQHRLWPWTDADDYGSCDTCGVPYELYSRDNRCGQCGECSIHCTH